MDANRRKCRSVCYFLESLKKGRATFVSTCVIKWKALQRLRVRIICRKLIGARDEINSNRNIFNVTLIVTD